MLDLYAQCTYTARMSDAPASIRYPLPVGLTLDPQPDDYPGLPTKKIGTGNAGWTIIDFDSPDERRVFMLRHPNARVSSWAEIEREHAKVIA